MRNEALFFAFLCSMLCAIDSVWGMELTTIKSEEVPRFCFDEKLIAATEKVVALHSDSHKKVEYEAISNRQGYCLYEYDEHNDAFNLVPPLQRYRLESNLNSPPLPILSSSMSHLNDFYSLSYLPYGISERKVHIKKKEVL